MQCHVVRHDTAHLLSFCDFSWVDSSLQALESFYSLLAIIEASMTFLTRRFGLFKLWTFAQLVGVDAGCPVLAGHDLELHLRVPLVLEAANAPCT